jgi:hypothetical protein
MDDHHFSYLHHKIEIKKKRKEKKNPINCQMVGQSGRWVGTKGRKEGK